MSSSSHSIPLEILDDLASRFIINIPDELMKDLIRICFQVELAHWFYIDEYVQDGHNTYKPKLKTCNMREFSEHIFRHIGFLRGYADDVETVLAQWKTYKLAVPTYGAIIMDDDCTNCLIAQSFFSKSSWGFPKGKVDEDELPEDCAAREVLEETGFDIKSRLQPDQYLGTVLNDQTIVLYLIPGVPHETEFAPKTRNEIRDLKWLPIEDLPASKKDGMRPNYLNIGPNNLYMVLPFTKSLKKWQRQYRQFGSAKPQQPKQRQSNSGAQQQNLQHHHDQQQQKMLKQTRKQQQQLQQQQQQQLQQQQQQQQINQQQQKAKVAKEKGRKSRNNSKSEQPQRDSRGNSQTHQMPNEAAAAEDVFVPQCWSQFKFNLKDIYSAMESTPGWNASK